jgi:DNA-binding CsgD family transcriptional regulator/tetratricopeptide (TPR) repeat protein
VPLAIELAAARVRVLPPAVLVERLESNPRQRVVHLLTGGARDLPARQQTLRATIDWSYDLLSAAERAVFRALGVFVGGCNLELAEKVIESLTDDGSDVLTHVEGLVNKSLLQVEPNGNQRFRMLETVREYALERLEAKGDGPAARRAHAVSYLALAERADRMLSSSEANMWLDRLEIEHDNLRAALDWVLDNDQPELAVQLTGTLWHFWYVRGHLREGGEWLERALQRRGSVDQVTASLARALTGAGVLAHYRGDYRLAGALCGDALAASRLLGDQACIAAALDGLALVARAGANYSAARAMYQEAAGILQSLGDTWGLGYTLRYLAAVMWVAADYQAARPIAERALTLARELRDQQGITTALTVLSFVDCALGHAAEARSTAVQALSLLEHFADRRGTARAHWALANALLLEGHLEDARVNYQGALTISRHISDQWFVAFPLIGLAELALHNRDPRQAVRLLAARAVLQGNEVMPCALRQVERIEAAARGALDDSSWAAAWEAGQQLTTEEAVEEALSVGPPTRAPAPRTSALTAREREVARLVSRGLTNKQIAAQLVIAEGTADRHVANILTKLDFATRAQIAAWVVDQRH